MTATRTTFVIAMAFAAMLGGCASSGTMVTAQETAQFHDGVTTRSDVVAKLGQPQSMSRLDDGTEIDVYTHIQAKANAASYIPVVGLLAGGADASTNTVTFTYSPDGKLKSVATSSSNSTVHTGLLNQN